MSKKTIAEHIAGKLTEPVRFSLPPMHELHEKGEHFFHCSYLLLVGIESHYWYGKVALVLLVWIVVPIFVKPIASAAHGPAEVEPDAEENVEVTV